MALSHAERLVLLSVCMMQGNFSFPMCLLFLRQFVAMGGVDLYRVNALG